jgi:hypothetical protein
VTAADGSPPDRLGAVFRSIHDVLAAEAALAARGVWHDLVPAPRELAADCGMTIEFRPADRPQIVALAAEGAMKVRGWYVRTAAGSCIETTLDGDCPGRRGEASKNGTVSFGRSDVSAGPP